MRRITSMAVVTTLLATSFPATGQTYRVKADGSNSLSILDDFRNDWTFLSPRRHCLGGAGLKDAGSSPEIIHDNPSRLEWMLADNFKIDPAIRVRNYHNGDLSGNAFNFTVNILSSELGYVAAQSRVDLKRVKTIGDALIALREPRPLGVSNVKLQEDQERAARGAIKRGCSLEFIAFAFGYGERRGLDRYRQARDAWSRAKSFPDSRPPASLFALNYMAERELLQANDPTSAFKLSQEPDMVWALHNVPNASYWLSSFYQYGVGTPVSYPAAISVFDKGAGELDEVESARLKAIIGRKSEAMQQIIGWEKKAWRSPTNKARANDVYRAISGQNMRAGGDGSAFLNLMIAVPLAIVAYCLQSAKNCPNSGGGGRSANQDYFDKSEKDRIEFMDRLQTIQDFQEVQTWKF